MTSKRKPSAYNRHVGREMKAGKTMKQAAASWKKKPRLKTLRHSSKPKKRKRNVVKKKGRKRSGIRLPGGLGPKGIAMGALGLMLVPRLTGINSPGGAKLATGLALRTLKIGGGGPLAAVGIMELALQYLGGPIAGFGFGAGGGGTDF